eukprot:Selendium_serpulae@DN5719_c0_g1_i1.p1
MTSLEAIYRTPFEGVEKRMIIQFTPEAISRTQYTSLRDISTAKWRSILSPANVAILSECKTEECPMANTMEDMGDMESTGWTAYLLSESSLFVRKRCLVLKTCGTTTPLLVLKPILEDLFGLLDDSAKIQLPDLTSFFIFSHQSFAFPEAQKYPHRSFDEEREFLSSFYSGVEHIQIPTSNNSTFYASLFVSPRKGKNDSFKVTEALMSGVSAESPLNGVDVTAGTTLRQTDSSCGRGRVIRGVSGWLKELMCPADPLKCFAKERGDVDVEKELSEIVYSNPCKSVSGLRHAKACGIKLVVFDNEDELVKVAAEYPEAQLLLRIRTDDKSAQCPMSGKYGSPPSAWHSLIRRVKALGLNLVGVDFHVGSGCNELGPFTHALQSARTVFDLAEAEGFDMRVLDLGGGFSGDLPGSCTNGPAFEDLAKEIKEGLESFPETVRVISEPGRFFASGVSTLAVKVFSRRQPISCAEREIPMGVNINKSMLSRNSEDPKDLGTEWKSALVEDDSQDAKAFYYINDGIYGSFNCLIYDHATIEAEILLSNADISNLQRSNVFGQTCDGLDCILKDVLLPRLEVGDWLMFRNMGAYTSSAASNFNGFAKPKARYARLMT